MIKVYAWENSFMAKLTAIRAEEMRFVRKARFTNAWSGIRAARTSRAQREDTPIASRSFSLLLV